jgi:hypothetical protein
MPQVAVAPQVVAVVLPAASLQVVPMAPLS